MNIKSGIVEPIYPPDKTNVLWVQEGILKHFRNGKWEAISQGETGTAELEEKVDSLDKEMGEVKNDLIKFGSTQGVVELQIGNSDNIKASNLKTLQSIQSTDHTFFTDIDYGYGTGQWLPTTGGKATIFTSAGHMVSYTIDANGAVTKASESAIGGNSGGLTVCTINGHAISDGQYTLSAEEMEVFKKGVDCIKVTETEDGETITTQVYFSQFFNNIRYGKTRNWVCLYTECEDQSSGHQFINAYTCILREGVLYFSKSSDILKTSYQLMQLKSISTNSSTETIISAINSILGHLHGMHSVWGPPPS